MKEPNTKETLMYKVNTSVQGKEPNKGNKYVQGKQQCTR